MTLPTEYTPNSRFQIQITSPENHEFNESAYAQARAFMQANGNATQWPDGYHAGLMLKKTSHADTASS